MNITQTIIVLMKKYVDQDAEYQRANQVVNEHKRIQEKLKELFDKQEIDQFVLNQDGYCTVLSFSKNVQTRVDVAVLPQEVKDLYVKEVIVRREKLNIINKPN